jgi:hypothetical protein
VNTRTVAALCVWGALAVQGAVTVAVGATRRDVTLAIIGAVVFCVADMVTAVTIGVWCRRRHRARTAALTEQQAAVAWWQHRRYRLAGRAHRKYRFRANILAADVPRMVRDAWTDHYEREAGDARARGEWVPTIEQLRVPAEGDNPWHP